MVDLGRMGPTGPEAYIGRPQWFGFREVGDGVVGPAPESEWGGELLKKVPKPRAVWLMVRLLSIRRLLALVPLLKDGDTIIDGGTSSAPRNPSGEETFREGNPYIDQDEP
jgi:6-phosphogluconate dehydrogenase (decarboxylating)